MTDVLAPATRRTAPPPPRAAALPVPSPGRLLGSDVVAVVACLAMVTTGMWSTHGGLAALFDGWVPAWTSVAQITGLLASLAGVVGLVLVARPRSLERRYGLGRLFIWHRYLGESLAVLVGLHVAASVVAWSSGTGVWTAVADLTGREPYLAAATVGAGLVAIVTVSSLRSVRRRLAYETWYFVHLLAYLALALAFAHEVVLGGDLADDAVARWFWIALHVTVLAWLLAGRWGRLLLAATRPLTVTSVTPVGPGTVSIRLAGPHLSRFEADAGQFFYLRPLVLRLWWQAHPYSLSAAPTTAGLRFTIKDRGDASAATTHLVPGTRVVVEGPYGVSTPAALGDRKVLLVAGGVGIALARSLLERLGPEHQPVVLYRARSERDLVHLDELQRLAAARNGTVLTLVGRTVTLAVPDPFAPSVLRSAVPDVADRTAVVCGPETLLHAGRRGLLAAGVPADRIHVERPWW
jgi:predicted ferric reductase